MNIAKTPVRTRTCFVSYIQCQYCVHCSLPSQHDLIPLRARARRDVPILTGANFRTRPPKSVLIIRATVRKQGASRLGSGSGTANGFAHPPRPPAEIDTGGSSRGATPRTHTINVQVPHRPEVRTFELEGAMRSTFLLSLLVPI